MVCFARLYYTKTRLKIKRAFEEFWRKIDHGLIFTTKQKTKTQFPKNKDEITKEENTTTTQCHAGSQKSPYATQSGFGCCRNRRYFCGIGMCRDVVE